MSMRFRAGSAYISLQIFGRSIYVIAGRRWHLGWHVVKPLSQWTFGGDVDAGESRPGQAFQALWD